MTELMSPSVECGPAPDARVLGASVLSEGPGWQGLYIPACVHFNLYQCKVVILYHCEEVVVEFLLKELSEERHFVIFHFGVCVINHLLTSFSFAVPV